MDIVDRKLLNELDKNCRITYRDLANAVGLSANAVKKRITNLIDTGVINEFVVQLRNNMAGATIVISLISTDGEEDRDVFYAALNEDPSAAGVFPQISKSYILYSQCRGLRQLNELSAHIRGIEHVTDVEMHLIGEQPLPDGKSVDLTKLQLRVLAALIDDPRKPIVDICEETGLTARRVRKILDEIYESDSIHFAVFWNANMGEAIYFTAKVEFDVTKTDYGTLKQEFQDRFPEEYWYSYISATKPVMFSYFVVEHTRNIQMIEHQLKNISGIVSVKNLVLYPVHILKFPLRNALKEMIDVALR